MNKQHSVERIHVRKNTVTVVREYENTTHVCTSHKKAIAKAEILAKLYNVCVELF